MNDRKRVILLIVIMICICFIVEGTTITILYRTAIREEQARLIETAQSQARLIESVARFDGIYSKDYPGGAESATLSQIIEAHEHYTGFGETGEFTLSKKLENNIVFLVRHRHSNHSIPKPVPMESKLAEPMRRALLGQSGAVIGLDYRGKMVLAAYEPVAELNIGIVAKIDMAEIRKPFIKSSLIGLIITFLAIFIGARLFLQITNPMIWELKFIVKKRTAELMNTNEQLKAEIEEHKRTERKLIEAEYQYRTVADFTYDWEYWSNFDGTLRYISPSCKRISGYEPEHFINNPSLFNEIVVPEDRDLWDNHYHGARSELKPREIQFRIRRRDGKIRWIEHVCQPVADRQGVTLGFRASNRDITTRKQFEIEVYKHREELFRLMRATTMGELSASLAHELNQPLTAILSNAQAAQRFLVRDMPNLDEVRNIMVDVVSESIRAGDIIQRLRLLMTKDEVRLELLNINKLIREAITIICYDIEVMNISMSMNLDKRIPLVKVDKVQLQQVILNLVLNALEAMKDKDPTLRQLVIKSRKGESGTIIVSVKDSGIGIEKEISQKIFEPFYTTKYGGLGMGLSINKRIIKAHGGRLWVENNPDCGSKFYFTLPTGFGGNA